MWSGGKLPVLVKTVLPGECAVGAVCVGRQFLTNYP